MGIFRKVELPHGWRGCCASRGITTWSSWNAQLVWARPSTRTRLQWVVRCGGLSPAGSVSGPSIVTCRTYPVSSQVRPDAPSVQQSAVRPLRDAATAPGSGCFSRCGSARQGRETRTRPRPADECVRAALGRRGGYATAAVDRPAPEDDRAPRDNPRRERHQAVIVATYQETSMPRRARDNDRQ
jgi:hypothetical protein